jgi:hypothetical protein
MSDPTTPTDDAPTDERKSPWDHYEYLYENRPEGDTSTCLRPLGKCEMGDCCDVCLHNPEREGNACRRSKD